MKTAVTLNVNGKTYTVEADTRMTLASLLREHLGLTGTHIGCYTGNCGACTVRLDGSTVKSCCVLAPEAQGCAVQTIESVKAADGTLHPVQRAFDEHQALQCGFCTPGMVLSAIALLDEVADPTEAQIRSGLAGNLCRCTGYANILSAVAAAARERNRPSGRVG